MPPGFRGSRVESGELRLEELKMREEIRKFEKKNEDEQINLSKIKDVMRLWALHSKIPGMSQAEDMGRSKTDAKLCWEGLSKSWS